MCELWYKCEIQDATFIEFAPEMVNLRQQLRVDFLGKLHTNCRRGYQMRVGDFVKGTPSSRCCSTGRIVVVRGPHTTSRASFSSSVAIHLDPVSSMFTFAPPRVGTRRSTRQLLTLPKKVNEPEASSAPYLNFSLLRVINFNFPLQPRQKYNITQYAELGFS